MTSTASTAQASASKAIRVPRGVRRAAATVRNGVEVLRFGGLQTGQQSSPFTIVTHEGMYRLRRYFPPRAGQPAGPVVVLVPPMMVSADVYDVTRDKGAVGVLHDLGIDPWVVDFGSPDRVEGGLDRTLSDHMVALSGIIDHVRDITGRDVHLAGYSQGGIICYQTAAYRRSAGIASVITFGSSVDAMSGLPFGIPAGLASRGAQVLADHVFNRISVPSWMPRVGFQLLDPVKSAQARLSFLGQLHDREALMPREQQRRFLEVDGWVAWSGPAVAELLRQFVVHNRMMVGGMAVGGHLVTLAEITSPVLAFIGSADGIGLPASVRGIKQAAARAEVSEVMLQAGHFGLVVGSTAAQRTWPTVAAWALWKDGEGDEPEGVRPMESAPSRRDSGPHFFASAGHAVSAISEVGVGVGIGAAGAVVGAARSGWEIMNEAARSVPRIARLGQLQPHTRVSFGQLLAEQARSAPDRECFLFDDRVHTNAAVDQRINTLVRNLIVAGVRRGVHVGVLMETSPSAVAAIAALSRLGAVAVLLAPGSELGAAAELCELTEILADRRHLAAASTTGAKVLVVEESTTSIGLAGVGGIGEPGFDQAGMKLPAWYRPNPGRARDLAFVFVTTVNGRVTVKKVTNHRWALSAYGTATAAALDSSDTVYCLTPLHHPSGLMVSLGGAIAGGARIALTRGVDAERFAEEVHRYGVTVVSYTWTILRGLLAAELQQHHPVRLFMGSGLPTGLWRKVTERFAPAQVLELYASTEGDAILANVSGAKVGAKGRPLPGSTAVRLAAYDASTHRLLHDERGFVRPCPVGEVGLLLARPRSGLDSASRCLRGVFTPEDAWINTGHLFRCDSDGDYWFTDNVVNVVQSARGPVFTQPICDALGTISAIDLVGVRSETEGEHQVAAASVTLWQGCSLTTAQLTTALRRLPADRRPEVVRVVESMPLTSLYRALPAKFQQSGSLGLVWRYEHSTGSYSLAAE